MQLPEEETLSFKPACLSSLRICSAETGIQIKKDELISEGNTPLDIIPVATKCWKPVFTAFAWPLNALNGFGAGFAPCELAEPELAWQNLGVMRPLLL